MTPLLAVGIGFVVALVVVIGILLFIRKALRGRGLSASSAARLHAAMDSAAAMPDPHRRVLEAAKVLDSAFAELGFQGSFADKLRAAGPRLKNEQAVWDALKLRNRIAHEVGIAVAEGEARRAVDSFSKALSRLG